MLPSGSGLDDGRKTIRVNVLGEYARAGERELRAILAARGRPVSPRLDHQPVVVMASSGFPEPAGVVERRYQKREVISRSGFAVSAQARRALSIQFALDPWSRARPQR
jgi:hypothetical protein